MIKCIYCLKEGSNFNSEHVIPKAIGLYGTNTPVLNCVCNECNEYFDKYLENPVFRKSFYNFIRHELMSEENSILKSDSKSRFMESNEFIEIRFVSNDILNGALLRFNIDTKKLDFGSQVGFKKKDGKDEYEYYSAEMLKKDKRLVRKLIENTKKLKDKNKLFVYGGIDKEYKRLCAFLYKLGVKFDKDNVPFPLPTYGEIEFSATLIFNDTFRRLMAKTAFNYFAYLSAGRLGATYLLKEAFHPIRRYIRCGENNDGIKFVEMKKRNIVYDEKKFRSTKIQTKLKAHLITVNSTGGNISATVDLFHTMGFFVGEVLLGKPKIGISFHEGRCFDYKNRKISRMISKYVFDRRRIILPG